MLEGLVLSFKIPQRQLGDLEVFWGGIGRGLTKRNLVFVQAKRWLATTAGAFPVLFMSLQRELGGEQSLGHPPTHV